MTASKKPIGPHAPLSPEARDIAAFQALEKGEAAPHQQKLVLEWLMLRASMIYDQSYWPDNPHATSFAEGRRFVGLQIQKLLSLNAQAFKEHAR